MGSCVSSNYCNRQRASSSRRNQQHRSLSSNGNNQLIDDQQDPLATTNNQQQSLIQSIQTSGAADDEFTNLNRQQSQQQQQSQQGQHHQQQQYHYSPSFSNITSTSGPNSTGSNSNQTSFVIANTITNSNSYSNSFSYYIPPTGKNKRLKKDFNKYFKFDKRITESQLAAKRMEFWDTAPAFEGKTEIWSALKAAVDACESKNFQLAQAIIDSANIILPNGQLNDCYDELGNRYQIPIYVLAKPVNMIKSTSTNCGGNLSGDDKDSICVDEEDSSSSKINSKNKKKKKRRFFGGGGGGGGGGRNNKYKEEIDLNDEEDDEENEDLDPDELENPKARKSSKYFTTKCKSSKNKCNKSLTNNKKGSNLIQNNATTVIGSSSNTPASHNSEKCQNNVGATNQTNGVVGEESFQIKLRVSCLNNDNDLKLNVTSTQTVANLKAQLKEITNIDTSKQRMFFGGKLLRDKDKLKGHKLRKNVVIQVIVREDPNESKMIQNMSLNKEPFVDTKNQIDQQPPQQQIASSNSSKPIHQLSSVSPQPPTSALTSKPTTQGAANASSSNQNTTNANNNPTKPLSSSAICHNVQNYIKELEISEGQLSSCLRNVYENKQKEEFMKRLEERVKQYDVEIEKLCNTNYQSFVDTFNELLSVREDTAELKNQLVDNNNKIQKIGKNLIGKVEELVGETKKHNNILVSIEALNKYMPVFNIYRQLKQQMQQKNYYPALKLLEDLENNYLPIVKHYRFSKSIHESIPVFKEEIKTETIADLKTFLESVRIKSEQCGKIANQLMANKLKIDKKYYMMDHELANSGPDSTNENEPNSKKLPFDVVDFSPLYRNLHMNQVLGSKAFFADYYRNQRRKQLQLHLQPPSNMESNDVNLNSNGSEHESLDAYKKYFHTVTGFFVIEDQILSSTEGLVDERYMDELFNLAIPRLINVIRKVMEQSKDADLMLKVKIVVVLFCNTIEEVQFPTVQLSDLLKEIRDKYYNMLLIKWNDKMKQILSQDNYNCMEIDDEETYEKLMKVFPCQLSVSLKSSESTNGFGNQSNPPGSPSPTGFLKRLPYSACVPKIFVEIKEFVNNCVKFAEGLNSSQTELDDMVRKPTNKLITDKLNENIRQLINKVSLAQLVQIVVNTIYLEKSIELLEQHLINVINASTSKQSGKLQGISVFKDLRSEAEARIYELLNQKIDELLDLENFNWLMNDITGQASDYMKSLLSFLKSILDSFNHLPSKLAQTACISACKHVAQSLMSHMTNPDIKAISFGAIEQLNLDLLQCEIFANTIKINGLPNETISLCFDDIRQLIDLLITKEWSIYLKDYGKPNNKYNRVNAVTALNLLEKLKEGAKKGKGLLYRLDIGTKDSDMKLMDTASKQLKSLISSNASF